MRKGKEKEKKRIVVVEDDLEALNFLTQRLVRAGYEVYKISDTSKILDRIKQLRPDLILLDILMPGLNGIEIKKMLAGDREAAEIPVIFLTAKNMTADKVEGLSLGVDDYITKPFNLEELLARVNAVLIRRRFYEEISMTDGLTGLYNVHYFKRQLAGFFSLAKGFSQVFTLVIIDIDNFKSINDTYGHAVGDFILKEIAAVMRETLRKADIVTRYGGDEFALILTGSDYEGAVKAVEKIRKRVEGKSFHDDDTGKEVTFSLSIGLATYNDNVSSAMQLFEIADKDMYGEKKHKQVK